uniref:Uncharacterized protein n=1 Tax=Oryza meridionalis TaxID=40149 RepID=A0A0E0FD21_9ORYZ
MELKIPLKREEDGEGPVLSQLSFSTLDPSSHLSHSRGREMGRGPFSPSSLSLSPNFGWWCSQHATVSSGGTPSSRIEAAARGWIEAAAMLGGGQIRGEGS